MTDYAIDELARWTSPRTKIAYPSLWRVRVPSSSLDLEIEPLLPDQELNTTKSTGVTYWEGAVHVTGMMRGAPIQGEAYVELMGYGDSIASKT